MRGKEKPREAPFHGVRLNFYRKFNESLGRFYLLECLHSSGGSRDDEYLSDSIELIKTDAGCICSFCSGSRDRIERD